VTSSLSRRTLLRRSGIAVFPSLAGCATLKAELGLKTQRLGQVVLTNSTDESFEVAIEVIRDGTTVLDSSYQLAPGSPKERPQIVLNEWKDNPSAKRWVVRARTKTSEWRNAELTAAAGERNDCHKVNIVTGDFSEASLLVVPTDCE